MSYQEKLDNALALVTEHNLVFVPEGTVFEGTPPEGYIDVPKFTNCIKFKARNEDALKGLKYEQILECLPTAFGTKPDSLARDIAKVFRGNEVLTVDGSVTATGTNFVGKKDAKNMGWPQLIDNLDPTDPTSAIYKRVLGVVGDKPFVVYSEGRTVDVQATKILFFELKDGHFPRQHYQGKEIYSLGVIPENYADENPLYTQPNDPRPLRPDGTCDQTGRSWAGVPLVVRQIAYLAQHVSKEVNVFGDNGLFAANAIISAALAPDAENALRGMFPKASVKFNSLVKTNELPALRVELGGKGKAGKGPFEGGAKAVWMPSSPGQNHYVRSVKEPTGWVANDLVRHEGNPMKNVVRRQLGK